MKNTIIINDILIEKNRIKYEYSIIGKWAKFFKTNTEFYIEYSVDISAVPKSIAVIPLICNILPIAWVQDAEIVVSEIDKSFFYGTEEIKQGYINMYPKVKFLGKVTAQKIVDNSYEISNNTAAFFSGGVDAFSTLISHIEEKPTLITVCGADISLTDTNGWENVKGQLMETANIFDLSYITVKSAFKEFLNHEMLDRDTYKRVKDNWWHGFQHGIGIISNAAPIAYVEKFKLVYIASSFNIKDKGKVKCASDPTIDNFVKLGLSKVYHDRI